MVTLTGLSACKHTEYQPQQSDISQTIVYNRESANHQFSLFISSTGLCDGGFVFREPRVYSVTEGGNITVTCSLFSHPQNRKFLCRGQCDKLLLDTDDSVAMSDRYKIRYVSSSVFNVTITQLTKSDSGRYRCGVGRQYAECQEFDITVTGGEFLMEVMKMLLHVSGGLKKVFTVYY